MRLRTTAPAVTASITCASTRLIDRKVWQAEIDKMVNVFGAPIEPKDAATIVDYLVNNYGTGE